jgi:hypothetical protein
VGKRLPFLDPPAEDPRYRRIARLMLRDGQIWFIFANEGQFLVGDGIADKAWELLDSGALVASQHNVDPGPPGEPGELVQPRIPRPQVTRFNRDWVLWIRADQG